jgi:diguanylate cyclase (GGDEF)-like protein
MPPPDAAEISLRERLLLLIGASVWIALTGVLDYASGVEVRIYPLYFLPICLVGWRVGYGPTLFAAWLSAATWLVSNYEAGPMYSSPFVWAVNTATQGVSFSTVGVLMVISRRAFRLAEARSRTDALTGLLNGRAFAEEAARLVALCERHGRPVTVAFLDLDDFKRINDDYGHAQGDVVLSAFGAALREAARETDLVGRIGGDEFAMVLAETDEVGARVVLSRLRHRLTHALSVGPRPVTASIGAISSMTHHPPIADLLRQADALLYDAKQEGKDQFGIASTEPAPPRP